MSRVAILFLIVAVAGCVTQQPQSNLQIKGYWDKIDSFKAEVTYTIGNESYTASIIYIKPDRAMKIENGTVVLIDGDTKTIVSDGKTFKLAASDFDLDTLDPFVAILNNLDSLNFKAENGKLVISYGDLNFAVELNDCMEVMQRYGVMFVPTIVSVNELNTTIFVGEKNIREGFGVWCRKMVVG